MAIKLNAATGGGSVALDAPNSTDSNADVVLTLPTNDGDSGQYLQTNGSGTLSWVDAGKILQVVQTTDTGRRDSTSATYADTVNTASITPTSSSNKVLVVVYEGQCYKNANDTQLDFQLLRGSTSIFTYAGLNIGAVVDSTNPTIVYLDSPATTSSTTYKTQFRNRDAAGTVSVNDNSTAVMILMEVAA